MQNLFMKKTIAISLFISLTVLLFVALFSYTGINKLFDIGQFEASMRKSELIRPYAKTLSYFIPFFELFICCLLIVPVVKFGNKKIYCRKIGIYLSAFLMLLFTVYVTAVLTTSEHLPCTCGGFISSMNWQQHLYFNSFLLLVGLVASYLITKNKNAIAIY